MRSVLIIDDQEELLDVTRLFLERFGEMNVETAKTAKDALVILKDRTFDALVVDFDLPDISGIELLKMIRSKGDTTPIIIFTGVGRENAAIEALNNGADFFLKKGEDPHAQFRNMMHMINQAVERRSMGRAIGTSARLLAETVNFFSEPAYAIDREGKVIAWNRAMADLTGMTPKEILGKGEGKYSVPFFGRASPMLTELVFDDEKEITRRGYTVISKDQNTIIAWTKTTGKEGGDRVLWMKASALHDAKGVFLSTIGTVRDITDELGAELLRQSATAGQILPLTPTDPTKVSRLDKLLGKARTSYKKGLYAYYREANYPEAIQHFDRAVEIDPAFAEAWHDRGLSLRELGKDTEALKSIDKAVELEPDNEEYLFTRAELLKKVGILHGEKDVIGAAVRTLNRVVELNPSNADAWNALGVCMKQLEKNELAKQYYDRAQELIRLNKSRRRKRNFDTIV
jgi:DNA-binding response OmpR family regulator